MKAIKFITAVLLVLITSFVTAQDFKVKCADDTLQYETSIETFTSPNDIFTDFEALEVRMYLSEDTIFDDVNDIFIKHIVLQTIDDDFSMTFEYEFSGYIFYVLDYYDRIQETDETNNIDWIPVTISSPSTPIKSHTKSIHSLHPNPVIDNFKTNFDYSYYEVYNITGVRQNSSVRNLSSGLYFIRFYDKNNEVLFNQKIIKK